VPCGIALTPQRTVLRETSINRNPGSATTLTGAALAEIRKSLSHQCCDVNQQKADLALRFLSVHPELRTRNSSVNFMPVVHQHQFLKARYCPILLEKEIQLYVYKGKTMPVCSSLV